MTQPTAPNTHPSETTPSAQQALDLLDELDDYLGQLKDETRSSDGDVPAAEAPSPPKPTKQPSDQVVSTAGETSHKDVSEEKGPAPKKTAASTQPKQRVKPKEPTKPPAGVKPQTQKIKQAGSGPSDSGPDGLDRQRRQLQAHQKKIEKAWKVLKREKMALTQQQLQLKADRQGLENKPRRPSGESGEERKLDLYREKLQERYNELRVSEAVVDLARQQYSELLDQRETLIEVKHFLASAEQEMVRRWSVHRGVGLVGGVVSCLLFLLLFSYQFGHRIVDPVWRASTVVGVTATVFDESRYGEAWLTEQHQLMVGDELLAEAIRLGAQRGVRIFDDVGAMREALTHGLTISQPEAGRIQLEFRHINQDLVVGVLKSLCRALVNDHTQADRVAGRPNSMRIYEAAARDPQPVEDRRMIASVVTLVVATAVVVVMSLVLRWWLARSVRVFEETGIPEMDDLESPEHWPEEPAVKKPRSSDQGQINPDDSDADDPAEEEPIEAQSESDQDGLADHAA